MGGILKRVTKEEYSKIRKEVFPNNEIRVKNTEKVDYAYQKTLYTMRVKYKHCLSEIEYFVPNTEWDIEHKSWLKQI